MGSKKNTTKNEGEKKTTDAGGENKPAPPPTTAAGGGKKDQEPIAVVLKMDLHCEGCAKKVRRSISQLEGVMKVKADCNAKELIVSGNVDPTWLRLAVENKTKKKVQLISPPPKTPTAVGGAAADRKPENEKPKENEPTADNNKNPNEAVVSTVGLRIKLHCDRCAEKIEKLIQRNIDGVNSVQTDLQKNLVTLNGTMDVKKLTSYLAEKLKRNVDILTPSNKANGDETTTMEDGVSVEKEEKESVAVAGTGNKKEKETRLEEINVGVNKMEYNNHYNLQTYYTTPMYNHTSYVSHDYSMPVYSNQRYSDNGYVAQYRVPPTPPPTFLNIKDSMFSDENPNECFVM